MPKLSSDAARVPRYCRHRASGRAYVMLKGKRLYLGRYGSKTSKAEYERTIAEWLVNGRRLPSEPETPLTVADLLDAYLANAGTYYRKGGHVTREYGCVQEATRYVRRLFGRTAAADFGPKRLKTAREAMVKDGLCRSHINKQVGRIKRCFRWAAAEELIPGSIPQNLEALSGLSKGRTEARETEPVGPVPDEVVEATLPHLGPVVAAMVQLQRLTGARPGEVCSLTPGAVDRSGDIWEYRPGSHKTEHRGRSRVIFVGPRGQEILRPFLLRPDDAPCFSPKESERHRRERAHEARTTPQTCGNVPGSNRRDRPRRAAGKAYTVDSYRRAIHRAVNRANEERRKEDLPELPRWSPNRLRHAAATEIRRRFGLEAAQVILGHSTAQVTQVYAQRDQQLALHVMRGVG